MIHPAEASPAVESLAASKTEQSNAGEPVTPFDDGRRSAGLLIPDVTMNKHHTMPLLLIALVGRAPVEQMSVLPEDAQLVADADTALIEAFSTEDPILFFSWDGRWIGMDCDTDIRLHGDGTATLTEYGYAVRKYEGTYSTDAGPEVSLSLEDYRGVWPTMNVYSQNSTLLLVPSDGSTDFVFGNRSGGTVSGGAGSFWPMRQVPMESYLSGSL